MMKHFLDELRFFPFQLFDDICFMTNLLKAQDTTILPLSVTNIAVRKCTRSIQPLLRVCSEISASKEHCRSRSLCAEDSASLQGSCEEESPKIT